MANGKISERGVLKPESHARSKEFTICVISELGTSGI
mgnify:CR=1 FL=1|jgi:hypothetical protein